MKQLFCLAFAWAICQTLSAQTNQPPRILCGNEIFHHLVQEKYPDLQAAFDATFDAAKNHSAGVADRSPLTVHVVVHVVWKNPAENLPDSVILNQMQVLNEDYNRVNADTADLRPAFQQVAGNADIHFQLDEIVRVKTTKNFAIDLLGGTLLAELKKNSTGGSDARDPDHYLNIWLCKIQPTTIFGLPVGQILGFAFPPNGLAHWPDESSAPTPGEDGVVIDYRMFGRNNPNPLPDPAGGGNIVSRGRTPVHEVGHYLGLRHIWGDGGLLGANECDQSDGVDDTPFANAQSEFDCQKTKNTCTQVETFYNLDMPDLVENYMDYSSEVCMNMFTKGQVEIMRNVLQGPRNGLLSVSSVAAPSAQTQPLQIVPNPVSDRTTVRFVLNEPAEVAARVYAADGQTLLEIAGQQYPSGSQRIELDTQALPSGVFFVEIRTPGGRFVGKMCKDK